MKSLPPQMLRTEAEYEAALAEFEGYFDDEPAPGSAAAERFVLLGALLQAYEEQHFPVD